MLDMNGLSFSMPRLFGYLGDILCLGRAYLTARSPMGDWYEQGHRDTIRSTYLRIGS